MICTLSSAHWQQASKLTTLTSAVSLLWRIVLCKNVPLFYLYFYTYCIEWVWVFMNFSWICLNSYVYLPFCNSVSVVAGVIIDWLLWKLFFFFFQKHIITFFSSFHLSASPSDSPQPKRPKTEKDINYYKNVNFQEWRRKLLEQSATEMDECKA